MTCSIERACELVQVIENDGGVGETQRVCVVYQEAQ